MRRGSQCIAGNQSVPIQIVADFRPETSGHEASKFGQVYHPRLSTREIPVFHLPPLGVGCCCPQCVRPQRRDPVDNS